MVNVGCQVYRSVTRKCLENALDAVGGGGARNEQHGVGVVLFEPGNNGECFANGRRVIMSCDKNGVAIELSEA